MMLGDPLPECVKSETVNYFMRWEMISLLDAAEKE